MKKIIISDRWSCAVSGSIFLFYALMLAVPSGYSYGASLLLLTSFIYLAQRPAIALSFEDKTIIYILLSIFCISLFICFFHDNEFSTLDQTSRCLLAIPILLLLLQNPINLRWLWGGLIIGSIAAAAVAAWQIEWVGAQRAAGFVTSAIPFGDIGLMMGILCCAGLFWARTQGRHILIWRAALSLGFVAGLYCSLVSESRGAWVALLPVAVLFCIGFTSKRNLKHTIAAGTAIVIVFSVLLVIPDSTVRLRYNEAVLEITNYSQQRDAKSSIGARLEAWRAAAINIPQKPLLGWSHSDYKQEMKRLVAEKRLDPFVLELANSHNNYVEVWIYQGLIGLLALLALYVFPFYFFCKRLLSPDLTVRVLAVAGTSLLASFFTFGMTLVLLGRNNGIMFFVVTLITLWASMRHAERKSDVIDGAPHAPG